MKIVTFAEIQKVKSSFEFKNSISSTRNCNEFRFFEPRFTSLIVWLYYLLRGCISCRFLSVYQFCNSLTEAHQKFKFDVLVCMKTVTGHIILRLKDQKSRSLEFTIIWNDIMTDGYTCSHQTVAILPPWHVMYVVLGKVWYARQHLFFI